MNGAQIRLVFLWIMTALLLTAFVSSARWLFEMWHYLKWPVFVLIVVAAAFSRQRRLSWDERSAQITAIVRQHPFIRVWLVIYGLLLAAAIFWALSTSFDIRGQLGPGGLFLSVIGLPAPFVIAGQLDKYRALGAQSDPPVDDARKSRARGSP